MVRIGIEREREVHGLARRGPVKTPSVDRLATSIRPRPASASAGASAATGSERDVSWTSTRNWPQAQLTTSSAAPPVACVMALTTSSPVSRTATDGSIGMSKAQMAASTSRRASAAAAGPALSEMLRGARVVGRIGVMVSIWHPC